MALLAIAALPGPGLAADPILLACTLDAWQQTGGAGMKEIFVIERSSSLWPAHWFDRTKMTWAARPGWEGLETTVIDESDLRLSAEGHETIRMPLPQAIDACLAERAQTANRAQPDVSPASQDPAAAAGCARRGTLAPEPKPVLVTVLLDRVTGDLEVWHVQGDKRHSVVQRGHCERAHPKF